MLPFGQRGRLFGLHRAPLLLSQGLVYFSKRAIVHAEHAVACTDVFGKMGIRIRDERQLRPKVIGSSDGLCGCPSGKFEGIELQVRGDEAQLGEQTVGGPVDMGGDEHAIEGRNLLLNG